MYTIDTSPSEENLVLDYAGNLDTVLSLPIPEGNREASEAQEESAIEDHSLKECEPNLALESLVIPSVLVDTNTGIQQEAMNEEKSNSPLESKFTDKMDAVVASVKLPASVTLDPGKGEYESLHKKNEEVVSHHVDEAASIRQHQEARFNSSSELRVLAVELESVVEIQVAEDIKTDILQYDESMEDGEVNDEIPEIKIELPGPAAVHDSDSSDISISSDEEESDFEAKPSKNHTLEEDEGDDGPVKTKNEILVNYL